MSAAPEVPSGGRLLAFEVGGVIYALPIAAVAEVTDVVRVTAVPSVPRTVAGVANHHGDALPVVERAALLPSEENEALPEPQHLLVLAQSPDDASRYGLPVDRIHGLVDGDGAVAVGSDPVAERRPVDGRIVNVLDPSRLLARAVEVIEGSLNSSGPAGPHDGLFPVEANEGEAG